MMVRVTLVAAFALFVAFAAPARAVSLDEGVSAYRENHVADAERMFRAIAADPHASAEDGAGAQRELGRIAWLSRGDTRPIADALANAPAGREACETAMLAGRIFREAGAADHIISQAAQRLADCQGPQSDDLRVELARDELAIAAGADRNRSLSAAADYLSGLPATSPDASATRFSLALMQRNADAALAAWRDYFWLTDGDVPQAMANYRGRAQAIFAAGLASNAAPADTLALLTLIARAGFIADALRLARETDMANAARGVRQWRELNALFQFDSSLRSLTLAVNRHLMAGQPVTTFDRDYRAVVQTLMRAAGLHGQPQEALLAAYGLYGTGVGSTGGFPSLHAGYVVQDDREHVEQYGRSGELRFVAVDHMIANGYLSWLWDGWAQVGGWAPDDATIVQVRSAYTSDPLTDLALSHSGPARDHLLAEVARNGPSERAALAGDRVATLAATNLRLKLQAIDAMAARAGNDTAFIAEAWRAILQHSIFIHEGRHVLDKAAYRGAQALGAEELEYRAKLSEIALADYPRLPLAAISSVNIGDGSAHGNAGARILAAYRDWMNAHTGEIAGYTASVPALAQLDKLSDDQIRAVARALDPWAH